MHVINTNQTRPQDGFKSRLTTAAIRDRVEPVAVVSYIPCNAPVLRVGVATPQPGWLGGGGVAQPFPGLLSSTRSRC